jgi:hypothetical protein
MEIQFDVEGVRDTVALLRKIEPESVSAMRKEIQTDPAMLTVVSAIKSRIPTVSPLQGNEFGYGGMIHNGRTSYGGANVKVKAPLNARIRSGNAKSIVVIDTVTPPNAVGFEIIDMVGRGASANSRKAVGMRKKLGGTPSRYVWKGFESKKDGVTLAINNILRKYADKVNVKLRVM